MKREHDSKFIVRYKWPIERLLLDELHFVTVTWLKSYDLHQLQMSIFTEENYKGTKCLISLYMEQLAYDSVKGRNC